VVKLKDLGITVTFTNTLLTLVGGYRLWTPNGGRSILILIIYNNKVIIPAIIYVTRGRITEVAW
jgi:hypothetical protein